MIHAGTLRQRITLQEATDTQDAAGQPIRSWSNRLTGIPARVETVSGGEAVRGRQVLAETTTLLTIRYISGLTSAMRVVWGDRILGVLRVNDPTGERRELRIECKESDR